MNCVKLHRRYLRFVLYIRCKEVIGHTYDDSTVQSLEKTLNEAYEHVTRKMGVTNEQEKKCKTDRKTVSKKGS